MGMGFALTILWWIYPRAQFILFLRMYLHSGMALNFCPLGFLDSLFDLVWSRPGLVHFGNLPGSLRVNVTLGWSKDSIRVGYTAMGELLGFGLLCILLISLDSNIGWLKPRLHNLHILIILVRSWHVASQPLRVIDLVHSMILSIIGIWIVITNEY